MARRMIRWGLIVAVTLLLSAQAHGWGAGHGSVRQWAVDRLPDWQKQWLGAEMMRKLVKDFSSLQDHYSGSKDPKLAPYCEAPGIGRRLHDVHEPGPSVQGMTWYLEKVAENMRAGRTEEAMKFLGVLCHWNEDPGSPSAHSSFWSEQELQVMVPPSQENLARSYTFGYKHIPGLDAYDASYLNDESHEPRLLGSTFAEAAGRIYQHQRTIRIQAASSLVKILVAHSDNDTQRVKQMVSQLATRNARHVTDIIYTALCLSSEKLPENQVQALSRQSLEVWWPDRIFDERSTLYSQPYYARPYLVNASFDSKRNLQPLKLANDEAEHRRGWGMTDNYTMTFTLAPAKEWMSFQTLVGVHAVAGEQAGVVFAVLIDDKVVAQSPEMKRDSKPHLLSVPLPKSDLCKLSLRTTPVPGSNSQQNLAVWADPVLIRP